MSLLIIIVLILKLFANSLAPVTVAVVVSDKEIPTTLPSKSSPPMITVSPANTTAELGKNVTLTCAAIGNPKPKIRYWFKALSSGRLRALAGEIALCSWARHLIFTASLHPGVETCTSEFNAGGGGTLWWTSTPSKEGGIEILLHVVTSRYRNRDRN